MSSQYYRVTAYVGTPHRNAVEVTIPLVGPAGPAGPAGTGLETLTTQGDTLYRGASTGERLPIGNAGQVLKVVNGLPAWAAESGAVTSVNSKTGAVSLTGSDIPVTRVFADVTSTNSQLPTQVSTSQYLVGGSLNVAVILQGTQSSSYADVFLPLLNNQSVGRVTVRYTFEEEVFDLAYLRVTTTDGEGGIPVYPASGYDEVETDQDFTFVWNGTRWTMEPRQAKTGSANAIGIPNHAGTVLVHRGTAKPTTPTSTGSFGQLAWGYDDGAERLYICVANNTWRRVPITTWS
jgi:hypothetical protein